MCVNTRDLIKTTKFQNINKTFHEDIHVFSGFKFKTFSFRNSFKVYIEGKTWKSLMGFEHQLN